MSSGEEQDYIERQAGSYGVDPEQLAEELSRYSHWDEWALMNAVARCQESPLGPIVDKKLKVRAA